MHIHVIGMIKESAAKTGLELEQRLGGWKQNCIEMPSHQRNSIFSTCSVSLTITEISMGQLSTSWYM